MLSTPPRLSQSDMTPVFEPVHTQINLRVFSSLYTNYAGAETRARTGDLFLFREALYQLSYLGSSKTLAYLGFVFILCLSWYDAVIA